MLKPQAHALDVLAGDGRPVGVGVGREVRGPGAGGAGELGQVVGCRDLAAYALEAPREHRELLAHGRRRRGLTVRAGEHRGVGVLDGELAQLRDHGVERREPDLFDGALHGEGVRGGVDVFARGGEVRELGDAVESERREPVAHEVLDRLHIVLGDRFLLGQPVDLGLPEVAVEGAQALSCRRRRAESSRTASGR